MNLLPEPDGHKITTGCFRYCSGGALSLPVNVIARYLLHMNADHFGQVKHGDLLLPAK